MIVDTQIWPIGPRPAWVVELVPDKGFNHVHSAIVL